MLESVEGSDTCRFLDNIGKLCGNGDEVNHARQEMYVYEYCSFSHLNLNSENYHGNIWSLKKYIKINKNKIKLNYYSLSYSYTPVLSPIYCSAGE